MTPRAQPSVAPHIAGAARRLTLLDSPLPLTFIEATPGAGISTLLQQWSEQHIPSETRLHIEADRLESPPGGILRMVAAATGLHTSLDVTDDEPHALDTTIAGLTTDLRRLSGTVAIAVSAGDFLTPDTFSALLRLLEVPHRVRLVVGGFDLTAVIDRARAKRIAFARRDDRDLALEPTEIRAMLRQAGLPADIGAVTALTRRTRGLPGIIVAAIDALRDGPSDAISAPQLRPGTIGTYLLARNVQQWPTSLARFIMTMAHVPRFSMAQAAAIMPTTNARVLADRMVSLDMGTLSFHPELGERVFTWHERVRQATLHHLGREPDDDTRLRRTENAARETFDVPLLVATLVARRQLDEAEHYLGDWLWDGLPNRYEPLFDPVARLAPMELLDHPRLLALRLRVDPRRMTRATALSARTMAERAASTSETDPWLRLGSLALAMEFARVARLTDAMAELVVRARTLIVDMFDATLAGVVGPRTVSDLLMIADATFRLGNTALAAEFADYALDVMDAGSRRTDPWGRRRACAQRLVLAARREHGYPDGMDAEAALAGGGFRWREADVAAHVIATTWQLVDDGQLAAAAATVTEVFDHLTAPQEWPGLWHLLARVESLAGRPEQSAFAAEAFHEAAAETGLTSGPEPGSDGRAQPQRPHRGLPSDPPFWQIAAFGGPADMQPRRRFDAALLGALKHVRAGHRTAARRHLDRAVVIAARRPLGPVALSVAEPSEIHQLADIIADHPRARVLQLDRAVSAPGRSPAPAAGLSERERQILELLRRGLTNKQISESLFISVNTVKFHRGNLMRKLGVSNRQRLIEEAALLGL